MDSLTALEASEPATVVRWIILTHKMPHIDIQQVEWPSDGCLNGGYLTEQEARQVACRKLERYIADEKKERAALARRRWHIKRRINEATLMLEELTTTTELREP